MMSRTFFSISAVVGRCFRCSKGFLKAMKMAVSPTVQQVCGTAAASRRETLLANIQNENAIRTAKKRSWEKTNVTIPAAVAHPQNAKTHLEASRSEGSFFPSACRFAQNFLRACGANRLAHCVFGRTDERETPN